MRGVIQVGKIESTRNLADLFAKTLPTTTHTYLLTGMVVMTNEGFCPVEKDNIRLNHAFERG